MLDIREIETEDCVFAKTPSGEQLGTVIGTGSGFRVDVILLDGRVVFGVGMMFVPLARSHPGPPTEGWTKVIVISGEHTGNFGFVRTSRVSGGEATHGFLQTH